MRKIFIALTLLAGQAYGIKFTELQKTMNGSCKGLSESLKLQQYVRKGSLNSRVDEAGARQYRNFFSQGIDVMDALEKDQGNNSNFTSDPGTWKPETRCLFDFHKATVTEMTLYWNETGQRTGCLTADINARLKNPSLSHEEAVDPQNKPEKCSLRVWNEMSRSIRFIYGMSESLERTANMRNQRPVEQTRRATAKLEAEPPCARCEEMKKSKVMGESPMSEVQEKLAENDKEHCCSVIEQMGRRLGKIDKDSALTEEGCERFRKEDPQGIGFGASCVYDAISQALKSAMKTAFFFLDKGFYDGIAELFNQIESDGFLPTFERLGVNLFNAYGKDLEDYYVCVSPGQRDLLKCEVLGEILGSAGGVAVLKKISSAARNLIRSKASKEKIMAEEAAKAAQPRLTAKAARAVGYGFGAATKKTASLVGTTAAVAVGASVAAGEIVVNATKSALASATSAAARGIEKTSQAMESAKAATTAVVETAKENTVRAAKNVKELPGKINDAYEIRRIEKLSQKIEDLTARRNAKRNQAIEKEMAKEWSSFSQQTDEILSGVKQYRSSSDKLKTLNEFRSKFESEREQILQMKNPKFRDEALKAIDDGVLKKVKALQKEVVEQTQAQMRSLEVELQGLKGKRTKGIKEKREELNRQIEELNQSLQNLPKEP